MNRAARLLVLVLVLLPGCAISDVIEVQNFHATVHDGDPWPLRVAILLPEEIQHQTVPSGSMRLNDIGIGHALINASHSYLSQAFSDTFVVYSVEDSRPRDFVIRPSIPACSAEYSWGLMFGNDYSCEMTLRLEVLDGDGSIWDEQYQSQAEVNVTLMPFDGMRGIERACSQAVGSALRRSFMLAVRDLVAKPPLVSAFSAVSSGAE